MATAVTKRICKGIWVGFGNLNFIGHLELMWVLCQGMQWAFSLHHLKQLGCASFNIECLELMGLMVFVVSPQMEPSGVWSIDDIIKSVLNVWKHSPNTWVPSPPCRGCPGIFRLISMRFFKICGKITLKRQMAWSSPFDAVFSWKIRERERDAAANHVIRSYHIEEMWCWRVYKPKNYSGALIYDQKHLRSTDHVCKAKSVAAR